MSSQEDDVAGPSGLARHDIMTMLGLDVGFRARFEEETPIPVWDL